MTAAHHIPQCERPGCAARLLAELRASGLIVKACGWSMLFTIIATTPEMARVRERCEPIIAKHSTRLAWLLQTELARN